MKTIANSSRHERLLQKINNTVLQKIKKLFLQLKSEMCNAFKVIEK